MYGTVTNWITYAGLRGLVVANEDASTQALQRASDYIRTRYVFRLAPAYTEESEEVIEAAYIAASFELSTPGFWAKTYTQTQSKVLTQVGDIKWTPVAGGSVMRADQHLPTSPAIEALFFATPLDRLGPLVA